MEVELLNQIKEALGCKSLEYFYSPDFGSANAGLFSDWRQKLQIEIDHRLSSSAKKSYCSISHSKHLGGAAFIAPDEGQLGFDIEESSRVSKIVAVRIADEKQFKQAPTPAALFVAKEAAFKSMRGPRQPAVISEVEIFNWEKVRQEPPLYKFSAATKGFKNQWFGVIYEDGEHTIGLCRFPHST